MGKHVQLVTPLLKRDYEFAIKLLRKHAYVRTMNSKLFKKVLPSTSKINADVVVNQMETEVKLCRQIAKRLAQRLKRMNAIS